MTMTTSSSKQVKKPCNQACVGSVLQTMCQQYVLLDNTAPRRKRFAPFYLYFSFSFLFSLFSHTHSLRQSTILFLSFLSFGWVIIMTGHSFSHYLASCYEPTHQKYPSNLLYIYRERKWKRVERAVVRLPPHPAPILASDGNWPYKKKNRKERGRKYVHIFVVIGQTDIAHRRWL